jgi:hypothetical protein
MTHLQEITLGDPRYGIRMESGFVLKTEDRFKMIVVKDYPLKIGNTPVRRNGLLLKGENAKFFVERKGLAFFSDEAYIYLWNQPFLFRPPQIHLLRALLKMNCSCSTCYRKAHPPTRAM